MDAVTASIIRRSGPAKTIRVTSGTGSSFGGAWATLVSITGRGNVFTLGGLSGNGVLTYYTWRVTIDGGTPITITNDGLTMYPRDRSNQPWAYLNVPFETSLLVEFAQGQGATYNGTAVVTWGER